MNCTCKTTDESTKIYDKYRLIYAKTKNYSSSF